MENETPSSGNANSTAEPTSATGASSPDSPFVAQVVSQTAAAPPPAPSAESVRMADENNLNLLSTFHYVAAGLVALMPCFSIFHLAFGIAILTGQFPDKNPPPPALGWIFVAIPLFLMAMGWTIAALMVAAGRRLRQRRSPTFCMVIAGISCMFFPWGTVLGVFTLVVLSKPSVRALFGTT